MIRLRKRQVLARIKITGLTIRAWAHEHGFPQTSLAGWIVGSRNIKHDNLLRLAQELHCQPEDIADVIMNLDFDQETKKQRREGKRIYEKCKDRRCYRCRLWGGACPGVPSEFHSANREDRTCKDLYTMRELQKLKPTIDAILLMADTLPGGRKFFLDKIVPLLQAGVFEK